MLYTFLNSVQHNAVKVADGGFQMSGLDIIIIVAAVIVAVVAGLYFLNKWAYQKMDTQQQMINNVKTLTNMYVIDKKKAKITEVNMPKVVTENMPKMYKFIKMRFVQAKIGPQIVTLICDKRIFDIIPVKKNIKAELAGIYIVSIPGMKSLDEIKKEKKEKNKTAKKEKKNSGKANS